MAYDLGDTATLRFEVVDDTDAPVVPGGGVTVTVTLPDGSTATPDVVNPATGMYGAHYVTTQVGRHLVRWVAAGTNASSDTDILDVRPADRGWLLSMADARQQLNQRTRRQDAEIRDWLGATTVVIERHTGRAWVKRTRSETARGGRPAIVVLREPIHSVISLVPLTGVGTTYDPDDLVWTSSGLLKLRRGGVFARGDYTLVYVAGDDQALPENVTAAARIILEHLWDTQRGKSLPNVDGDAFEFDPGIGYAIPNRAVELLGPAVGGLG